MGTSIVNNGLTGLLAAQAGILTTSHNISNASTPGYSRQTILQTTNQPLQTGSGFFGQGTNVSTVQRMYSQYLSGSVMAAQTQVGAMDSYLAQVQQIDNMLADSSAGLSPALSDFFSGVQNVAANPSSVSARQSMISSAQALTARFQSVSQNLDEQRQGVNEQITSEVGVINSYASQIAAVNDQIILAKSGNANQQPNDLLDQRDQLLQQLNKEIRVSTTMQSDGTVSVFIGNGQPLVMNTNAYSLVAKPASSDPQQIAVAVKTLNNNTIELQQDMLSGGTLGGLISFQNESLNPAQNELGRVAINLAQEFNQQHAMGQDLNGAMGGDLFTFPTNTATGMDAYMNLYANKNNTGTATLTAQIVQSDYRVESDGTNYYVYRLNDNGPMAPQGLPPAGSIASFAPGGSVVVDGVTITGAGAPAAGDAFTVKPGDPAATRIVADSTNGGTGGLTATQAGAGALAAEDYRIDYTGVVSPQSPLGYVVTRLSDNTRLTPSQDTAAVPPPPATATSAAITFDGVTIVVPDPGVGGTPPAVGDSYILQPTRNAARDITVNISDPKQIAAGAPFRTSADSNNIGSATISAGSVIVLDPTSIPLTSAANPTGKVTLTFNGPAAATPPGPNTWSVSTPTGNPTQWNQTIPAASFTAGQQNVINLNGIQFTLAGTPQNGDKLYLDPNSSGVSDNRNAQALGALQTMRLMEGNSATYEEAYAQIVSQIGNKTREVTVTGQAQQSLANQANDAVQQLSGVNLDEEAANLIRYQQAYQASAKMIDVGSKLFDTLLQSIG